MKGTIFVTREGRSFFCKSALEGDVEGKVDEISGMTGHGDDWKGMVGEMKMGMMEATSKVGGLGASGRKGAVRRVYLVKAIRRQ